MKKVQVWTDGSSDWNTRMGGWAAVLLTEKDNIKIVRIIGQYMSDTTNNVMEAYAVLAAIEALYYPCHVEIITDSQYVIYGIRRIMTGKKLLETNTWLWEMLQKEIVAGKHRIDLTKIKGHDGEYMNEIADQVAVQCRTKMLTIDETIHDFNQRRLVDFMGRISP